MSAPEDAVAQMMRQAGVDQPSDNTGTQNAPEPAAPVPAPAPTPAALPTSTKSDSMGPEFAAHSQAISMQSAVESMRELASGGSVSTTAPPPKPTASDSDSDTKTLLPDVKQQMIYDPNKGAYVPDPNYKNYNPDILGRVATDVLKGTLEGPLAAVQGVRNGIQSMIDGADAFNSWWTHKAGVADALHFDETKPWELPEHLLGSHEAKSVTGSLIEGTAQFLTGMKAAGAVLGEAPSTIKGAAAMLSAFEGKGEDLSNLVQRTPLANPVTEFLASKPDDNEAVGRLKKAVEGVGLGALADGLVSSIRMLKGSQEAAEAMPEGAAEGATEETAQAPTAASSEIKPPSGLDALGDANEAPTEPLVRSGPAGNAAQKATQADRATRGIEPEEAERYAEPANPEGAVRPEEDLLAGPDVPGATEAQAKEPSFHINFARINGPDDVKRAMSEMATAQAGDIDAARRGVQSFEDTKFGASLKDGFQVLMDRRPGEGFANAEEMLAAKQVYYQSGAKTVDAINAAVDNPTPENIFAYRKMMQTHAMVQKEFLAAQAETARTQSAMRIPVGEGDPTRRLESVMSQLKENGGFETNLQNLYKIKQLVDAGDMATLGSVSEKSLYARTRDQLLNAWTNGLLTNPLTHVKVNLSNAATIGLRLTETKIAESLDSLLGTQGGVVAGETAQTAAGLVQSIKDTFRYVAKQSGLNVAAPPSNPLTDAAKAFSEGRYSVGNPENPWGSNVEDQLATEANTMSDKGWWGSAVNLAQQAIRLPGRSLTAEHEFYRSIGMRMELNRYAIRQATDDLNAGRIGKDDFQGRISELVENPPPQLFNNAANGMTYQTFTDAPGKLAETIEKLRTDFPALRALIPFYKIPSRMLSFTFERSPLAPLMSSFQQNIAAGGARASMAKAQLGLGSAVMLGTADNVFNGNITGAGPKEAGKRGTLENEGWQPYSMKVGDRWVQYNRLETVGSAMAMAADIAETLRDYHTAVNSDDADTGKLVAAGTLAIANDVLSKTYFEGIANFFAAINNPKEGASHAVNNLAGSLVPAGVGAIARQMDPYNRSVHSMMDAIKARTPGVSQSLPPQRNVWGDPVTHTSGFGHAYDAFVPFATKPNGGDPIDQEANRLGLNLTLPDAKTSINGVQVNLKEDPAQYSRYVELAGNEQKNPTFGNRGAKDALNALVSGTLPGFSQLYNMRQDGSDGGKALMIRDMRRTYEDQAKQTLLKEYPELAQKVEAQRKIQQSLKSLAPPSNQQ